MGKGCKILLIVGIILMLLVGVGLVLSFMYCKEISSIVMTKSIETLEAQVLQNLPEGFTADDVKHHFKSFKDAVVKQIGEGKINSAELSQIFTEAQKMYDDKSISTEELTTLFDRIKKFIGQ